MHSPHHRLPATGPLRSGRFVAWGNAVLAGLASPDLAAERILGPDRSHRIWHAATLVPALAGMAGADRDEVGLPVFLAGLRGGGVRCLRLALPVPGDPAGLPGPPEFNTAALAAGEAVLALGVRPHALLPCSVQAEDSDATAIAWQVVPTADREIRDQPSLAEVEQELTESIRAATAALEALEVARWRPEAAESISAIRQNADSELLAPGYPARAHRILALAQRIAAITALAAEDPGAAVSARRMTERDSELRPLARAARRAQVAAYNAAEPGG